ncbi:hypothetical protein Sden_2110 [Shewanella denitrificans OS217]|uniref:Uncharacterized protein n=1 Tax=Shewanella denitrificans (strain OS217 / ATCC BAA-1090 / DSM 15013) TaxID=318161 RepID=Q12MD4_SHEDO|nr:YdbH domain-containing protein [Shewanella denitrificans]ABE55392.1 hypothetical protein Sden_2110 [Shewanella denitrificans OS217]
MHQVSPAEPCATAPYRDKPKSALLRRPRFIILLALMLLLAMGILVLFHNANSVSQFLIRQFAATYEVNIVELEDNHSTLDSVNLARLKLNYQGSELTITDLKLTFFDGLAMLKRRQLLSSDLKRISLSSMTLNPSRSLIEQMLMRSEQTQHGLTFNLGTLDAALIHADKTSLDTENVDKISLEPLNLDNLTVWLQTLQQKLPTQLPELQLGQITIELPSFSTLISNISPNLSQPIAATVPAATISLPKLVLNPRGELSTELLFNQLPIIAFDAKLDPNQLLAPWQLDTELSLTSAHQGLVQLASYLDASRSALALEPSQIHSQINRIINALNQISAKGIKVSGLWQSHSEFSAQDLTLHSQHSLSEAEILLTPALAEQESVYIKLQQPVKLKVSLDKQNMSANLQPLGLSLTLTPAQRQLIAASFSEANLTSKLEPWLSKLSLRNDTVQQIDAISHIEFALERTELTMPSSALKSVISQALDNEPLDTEDKQTTAQVIKLTSPNAMLRLKLVPLKRSAEAKEPADEMKTQAPHQQQLTLSNLTTEYEPLTKRIQQEFDVNWHFSQQSPLHLTHSALSQLPFANFSIEKANITLDGHAEFDYLQSTNSTEVSKPSQSSNAADVNVNDAKNRDETELTTKASLKFTLAPSSQLSLSGMSAALGDTQLSMNKLHLQGASQTQVNLNASRPISSQKANVSPDAAQSKSLPWHPLELTQAQVTLADMNMQISKLLIKQFAASEGVSTDAKPLNGKHQQLEAKAENLNLRLNDISKLDLGASLGTLFQNEITAQLQWDIAQLDVRKHTANKRTKAGAALLVLDSLSLKQRVKLNKGVLSSQDDWLFETQALSSQHWLNAPWLTASWLTAPRLSASKQHVQALGKPSTINPAASMATSLAGQWQFEFDITQALAVAAKTQTLPKNTFLQGQGSFNGSYLLRNVQDSAGKHQFFEFRFEPEFDNLSGDYLDYNFSGARLSAKCQLDWQRAYQTQQVKSLLSCPDTQVSAAEANLGLRLDRLKLQTDIQLTQDDSKPATNWLQLVTGLSHTEVNLTASGDILDGHFLIPEFTLRIQDTSKGHILLQGLSLEAFLAAQPQVGVQASGIFDGVLPATFTDGKLQVSGGLLAARAPGGRIQVSGNPAIDELTQMQPHLALVFTALEDLNYHQLSSSFDMAPNTDAKLNLQIKGNSVGIERPIHLNYSHEENLLQLYRSLRLTNQLQDNIEQSMK